MYTAIDRTIYKFKFQYACQHADKVIAISECTKQDIIRYLGTPENKIEVIYQAIQPTFYTRQPQEQAKQTIQKYQIPSDFLLYVGAINSRKNLLGIVKALALLPREYQIPLVIIGNGHQYKEEVLKFAARAHLSDRLILLPNLHVPSFYEGFGLPVTEALLSKVPVITSNRSCLPEAGGPDSCYIQPEYPEEIAEAITSILSDEEKRLEMTEKDFNMHKINLM